MGPTPIIAPLNETPLIAIGQKRACYRRIVQGLAPRRPTRG